MRTVDLNTEPLREIRAIILDKEVTSLELRLKTI